MYLSTLNISLHIQNQSTQNYTTWNMTGLKHYRIETWQDWNMPGLKHARIETWQDWNITGLKHYRIETWQDWKIETWNMTGLKYNIDKRLKLAMNIVGNVIWIEEVQLYMPTTWFWDTLISSSKKSYLLFLRGHIWQSNRCLCREPRQNKCDCQLFLWLSWQKHFSCIHLWLGHIGKTRIYWSSDSVTELWHLRTNAAHCLVEVPDLNNLDIL